MAAFATGLPISCMYRPLQFGCNEYYFADTSAAEMLLQLPPEADFGAFSTCPSFLFPVFLPSEV